MSFDLSSPASEHCEPDEALAESALPSAVVLPAMPNGPFPFMIRNLLPPSRRFRFFFRQLQVGRDHDPDQLGEFYLRAPAEYPFGLAVIADQDFDLGQPEVAGVHLHQRPAGLPVHAGFFLPPAPPADLDPELGEGPLGEFPDGVPLARGDHEVIGLLPLEDQPHRLHEIRGVAPVALGVQVAQVKLVLQSQEDPGGGAGDLAGDEGFAPPGRLVVEKDPVAGEHPVGLAVIDRGPVGVELGRRVGTAGVEGRGLRLGELPGPAKELAGGGLIEPGPEPHLLDRVQEPERADRVHLGRVLGHLEGNLDMALGRQVVDLFGLDLLQDPVQVA